MSAIDGWKAYFKQRDEYSKEREKDAENEQKLEKAKEAAKRGGF